MNTTILNDGRIGLVKKQNIKEGFDLAYFVETDANGEVIIPQKPVTLGVVSSEEL